MASVGRAAVGAEPGAGLPGSAATFASALRAVALRVRVQRALSHAVTLGLAGLGVAALGLCLLKVQGPAAALPWLTLGAVLPALGLALGALRPVSPLLAARLLDRGLGLPDLFASALSFERVAEAERTPFMQACIRDASSRAHAADARRALPFRAPRALRPAVLVAAGVAALALLEVRVLVPVAKGMPARARLLHQDDVQAFQDDVAPLLETRGTDPALQETARELNTLLEALHEGELDRAQALAALRALEKKLELTSVGEDDEALREALRGVGRALERDPLAKSVAQAMQDADAATARKELEKLAGQLREGGQRAEALRNLAKALERAAKPRPADDRALSKAREERDRLLKKREQAKAQEPREQRLLRDKQREVDRLEREQAQRQSAERKLDRLRREFGQASPALQGKRGAEAGERLEQAAQQLAQAQEQQLSAEQREQLKERLAQLRELISKQRGQGQGQQQQAGRDARGQGGGQGQRLDLERFARGSRGQQGSGQNGAEQPQGGTPGKPGGKLLVPGQGGGESELTMLMPGQGQGQGQMHAPGGEELAGAEGGQGGRPQSGDATSAQTNRVDTRVQGAQGAGATRSEVILEAGQRGFVSRDYERVHTEYERHAEAVLERDRVPGGYRFYVRRYFQLIRPREGEP